MFEAEKSQLERDIQVFCQEQGLPVPPKVIWSQIPFAGEWGLATSFFQIAADEARSGKKVIVPQRAAELAEAAAQHLGMPPGFARVETVKGYLNLYFSAPEFATRVVASALEQASEFGRGPDSGQQIMVEFSQPNTHKAFHVGHLRNMILGAALANILEFAGHKIVRANYIGDFGKDVFKWMWNFRARHADEMPPEEDVTRWMGDLYAESSRQLAAQSEQGETEIKAMFAAWEADDPEVHALWEKTRQWSLDGFNQIYAQMDIRFDRIYYESEMERPADQMVAKLVEDEIALDERPEGPVIVKLDELLGLEEEKYRVLVLLRSDGTSLYGAWDLALALTKFHEYELDRSIYVVDVRQSLHFQQVFKTLELAGYGELIEKVLHLPYEVVTLPGNVVLSSREGTVVLLEELIREAIQRSAEIVAEKNPQLDPATRAAVAKAVGLAALKYPMLARENTKVATFDWEAALDFNGQAAPYIQYAHVRANSILRRVAVELPAEQLPQHALEPSEIELIDLIAQFPEVVQRAAEEHKTLHITNHAYELARAFNNFYANCPVMQAEGNVRNFRLRLVAAAKQTLANGLALLGIQAPDVM